MPCVARLDSPLNRFASESSSRSFSINRVDIRSDSLLFETGGGPVVAGRDSVHPPVGHPAVQG